MALVVKFLFIFAPDYTALYVRCPRQTRSEGQPARPADVDRLRGSLSKAEPLIGYWVGSIVQTY